jgi:isoquinoline 1-oxidoreductase beta subunit
MTIEITRRSFIAALGGVVGGLALGFRFDATAQNAETIFEPSAFLHISNDGIVTIVSARAEMGQGVRSSLPVIVADELGADWAKVKVVQADADAQYGDQNTDGSHSVRSFYQEMRMVGATARTMLVAAAAQRWKIPVSRITVKDHFVHDLLQKRSLAFKELVADAAKLPIPNAKEVVLRPDNELKRVGRELPLIDGPAFVTGKAIFGADVQIPGMLTAIIVRPPVVGGKVVRLDDSAALKIPGVRKVITLPSFTPPANFQPLGGVAVVADHTWAAMRGSSALKIEWDHGENKNYDSDAYKTALETSVRKGGTVLRQVGNVDQAFTNAKRTIEAEYYVPHLDQAPMEPPAAVARFEQGRCEIWTCIQNPQGAQEEAARALGIDKSKVTVHVTFLGGGFGRKSKPDYVAEAAILAREANAPVRVQWTRPDEIRHGYYHACSKQRIEAGLDSAGKIVAWRHRIASPPIDSTFDVNAKRLTEGDLDQGILDLPLTIPNVGVESCDAPAHVRIGWLRSVYNINHAFAVQSFIAELAHELKRDHKDLLLEVLGSDRMVTPAEQGVEKIPNYGASLDEYPVDVGRLRAVIENATKRAGWNSARKSERALGLAAHRSFLSYVAAVAAVSKDKDDRIRIDEIWITADCGKVVNLDRVKFQFEGAAIFGMTLALHGSITARNGAIQQTNFRDYPLLRIGEAPRAIHVEIISSTNPPAGVGEPGVPPIAPAIANAIFALTGKRYREIPFSKQV